MYNKHKTRFHDYSSNNEDLLYGKKGYTNKNISDDELPVILDEKGIAVINGRWFKLDVISTPQLAMPIIHFIDKSPRETFTATTR